MNYAQALFNLLEDSDLIGKWLSAALDDPKVCAEMKEDIEDWFKAVERAELALGGEQE